MKIEELISKLSEISNKEDYLVSVDFPSPFEIEIRITK